MPERRIAAIAISFAAGIFAANCAAFPLCAAAAALAFVTAFIIFRDSAQRTTLAILAAVFILGSARYAVSMQVPSSDISRTRAQIAGFEGQVVSDPEAVSDYIRLILQVDRVRLDGKWLQASGNVIVNMYENAEGELPHLEYGDHARLNVSPYSPLEPTNPGQFSWKQYLARQGIYTCASVRRPGQVQLLSKAGGSINGAAYTARDYLVDAIYRTHPEKEAAVIAGIALGTYSYLPQRTLRDFTNTGTLHILAASGYNCFILLLIAGFILKHIGVMPKWRNLAVIGLIAFYLIMVGPKPSLVRAAVMASLTLLAVPLRRIPNIRSTFFCTAFIVLLLRPMDLFDVGFQLSFLAVGALIWASPIVGALFAHAGLTLQADKRRCGIIAKWLRKPLLEFTAAAIATIAISLVTGPVVAYHFNYISLTSVPANMTVALLEPIVFADGFISAAVAPLGAIGRYIGFLGTWTTRLMLRIIEYFGSMDGSAVSVPSPGIIAILGYYLALYASLSYIRSKIDDKKT